MATYAIGDIQGCYDELQALLDLIGFDPAHDRLWVVGDLVNRGPKSLQVLRYVKSLGERAVVVIGNHDLHLVAQFEGFERARKDDTLSDVFAAPDAKELVDWLRTRRMMHVEGNFAMVHAGIAPQWSVEKAAALAREVEQALAAPSYRDFLQHMYGSKPARWEDSLQGWDRLRVIVNAMTRMRFCTADGTMDFATKAVQPPTGTRAWFDVRKSPEQVIVFGHWSQLGLKLTERYCALDSGCVWGGQLSALRLEDRWLAQVPSRGYSLIGEPA
jgi:bis(5'-nucleosyl)-tetraphosphatase (symmetrical)